MTDILRQGRTGIGVITHNRPRLFKECITGIPEVDYLVVINDGDPYPSTMYPSRVSKMVQHPRNLGIAKSKNDALSLLLSEGCSHLFLCEDDIKILDPDLCDRYVLASEQTGIMHFNFGFHGPRNKSASGVPHPRKQVDYGNNVSVILNRHLIGAFSYYRDKVLIKCGLIDPRFKNMLDHVDHTYRIIKEGFHPPFWWFADLAESWRFIADLDPDLMKSTVERNGWRTSISFRMSNLYYFSKHGCFVQNMRDAGEPEVAEKLNELQRKYGVRTSG